MRCHNSATRCKGQPWYGLAPLVLRDRACTASAPMKTARALLEQYVRLRNAEQPNVLSHTTCYVNHLLNGAHPPVYLYLHNACSHVSHLTSASPTLLCVPTLPTTRSVGYLGTSRKRVSFSEYSEQWDFTPSDGGDGGSDGEGSAGSISEDELLAAQGARSLSVGREMIGYDEVRFRCGPELLELQSKASTAAWKQLE